MIVDLHPSKCYQELNEEVFSIVWLLIGKPNKHIKSRIVTVVVLSILYAITGRHIEFDLKLLVCISLCCLTPQHPDLRNSVLYKMRAYTVTCLSMLLFGVMLFWIHCCFMRPPTPQHIGTTSQTLKHCSWRGALKRTDKLNKKTFKAGGCHLLAMHRMYSKVLECININFHFYIVNLYFASTSYIIVWEMSSIR